MSLQNDLEQPNWTDLISNFVELSQDIVTPDIFRLWSGIALVGGALERRCWTVVGDRQTFPNLYTLLVAPPGVGKQIVDKVGEIWAEVREPGTATAAAFHVAPDSVTKASLIDTLAESKRSFLPPKGALVTYHSLLVAAEEFGVLLPAYDQEFIANLNKIFNNPASYRERRRTGNVRKLEFDLPQLNILAGVTPSYFTGTFPEEAWSTGFARRIIMIYSSETPFRELWSSSPNLSSIRSGILSKLQHLASLYGPFRWTPEAADRIAGWHRAGEGKGGPPIPTHSKLEHYVRSRTMHALKLIMVSAASRLGDLVVEDIDAKRGIEWLIAAERMMPDIFRAMVGRSDIQIMEELHFFVQAQWARNRQKPVSGEVLRRFLASRLPHDKIESLLGAADRANIIARIAGADTWIPRPKHEHGVE